jgi:hypothetical protein
MTAAGPTAFAGRPAVGARKRSLACLRAVEDVDEAGMARVQDAAVRSPDASRELIRPRQSVLALLLLAYGGLVALVVVGASRSDQPLVAWVGVAFAVVFLPVVAFYRRGVAIEGDALVAVAFRDVRRIAFADIAGYGIRRGYVYKSGVWSWLVVVARDGTRIDIALDVLARRDVARILDALRERAPRARTIEAARPRMCARFYAVVIAGALLIALALVAVGVVLPRTLGGSTLFSQAAACGLVAGLVFGAAAARSLVPETPIVVVVMGALAAMVVVPAVALFANMALPAPLRTTRLTVLDRHAYADREGRIAYRTELELDGVHRRLSPPRDVARLLEKGRSFDACVRDGALGYVVILGFTRACGGEARAPGM